MPVELLPMFDVVFICFSLLIFLYLHSLLGLFIFCIFVLLISNIFVTIFFCNLFRSGSEMVEEPVRWVGGC